MLLLHSSGCYNYCKSFQYCSKSEKNGTLKQQMKQTFLTAADQMMCSSIIIQVSGLKPSFVPEDMLSFIFKILPNILKL